MGTEPSCVWWPYTVQAPGLLSSPQGTSECVWVFCTGNLGKVLGPCVISLNVRGVALCQSELGWKELLNVTAEHMAAAERAEVQPTSSAKPCSVTPVGSVHAQRTTKLVVFSHFFL